MAFSAFLAVQSRGGSGNAMEACRCVSCRCFFRWIGIVAVDGGERTQDRQLSQSDTVPPEIEIRRQILLQKYLLIVS
mgnify:CR=1 FL=1